MGPRFPIATVLPRSGSLQPALREWVSQMADHRQHAPATLRNRDAILGVLRSVLPTTGIVLEIASGTGEHVVHFAQDLAGLIFQPSDPDPDALLSVSAWVKATRSTNVRPPVILDASQSPWPIASADGIICINMVHVSPWKATVGLMRGAGEILPPAAPLYLYGPYKRQNIPTAASNEAFDRSVRDYEPTWGLRDLLGVSVAKKEAGNEIFETCRSYALRDQFDTNGLVLFAHNVYISVRSHLNNEEQAPMTREMTRADELEQIRTMPHSAEGSSSPNIILLQEGRLTMLERQREGIAAAKAAGKYKGRKPTAQAKAPEVCALKAQGVCAPISQTNSSVQ